MSDHPDTGEMTAMQVKLDAILAQTKLTNGRVNALERDIVPLKVALWGEERGTHRIVGIVEQVEKNQPIINEVRQLVTATKWLLGVVATSAIGGAVAVLAQM